MSSRNLKDDAEVLDMTTFEQILEMDDDDDREFSKGIVAGFFEQAAETFNQMEKFLQEKNLEELSSLGHFLKGSSATIGLVKIKEHCEKIQHYGAGKNAAGTGPATVGTDRLLQDIHKEVQQMQAAYERAKIVLGQYGYQS